MQNLSQLNRLDCHGNQLLRTATTEEVRAFQPALRANRTFEAPASCSSCSWLGDEDIRLLADSGNAIIIQVIVLHPVDSHDITKLIESMPRLHTMCLEGNDSIFNNVLLPS
jgi:hypothetical protein